MSPTQAAIGPIMSWLFAAGTGKESFKKGLPPTIHVDHPAGMPETEARTWRDQYMTRNVGSKNIGTPVTTKGGAAVKELQAQRIDAVFKGKDQCRDEILSIYGVPPAQAGVIESGNLGGGTGDSQFRTFVVITCEPVGELVLEALNFSLVKQAFAFEDWLIKFRETDYRDSQVIENIRDQRLRNGAWTLNKYRQAIGEPPVKGGDDAVIVDRQNLVLWVDMAATSKAQIAYRGAPLLNNGMELPVIGTPPGAQPALTNGWAVMFCALWLVTGTVSLLAGWRHLWQAAPMAISVTAIAAWFRRR